MFRSYALFALLLSSLSRPARLEPNPKVAVGKSQIPFPGNVSHVVRQCPSSSMSRGFQIPDVLNLSGWAVFLGLQVLPAKTTDVLPKLASYYPFRSLSKSIMKICERSAVADCMPYENPRLPANFQGIWWSDGLGDPTCAVSSGGAPYDPQTRTGVVSTYANQQWGFDATNSTWRGLFWHPSGAALLNGLLLVHLDYRVTFNEDFTFGRITPVMNVFGSSIVVPTFILDFSMEWVGDETWRRTSKMLFFFSLHAGNYHLRRIINGDGSKGYWFDKGWLTYKNGIPLAVSVPFKAN